MPPKSAQLVQDPDPSSQKLTLRNHPVFQVGLKKQVGYREGLAPSVGHLGNCLSAELAR